MQTNKTINGVEYVLVCCKYIRKNGRIIYPRKSKSFCFWVRAEQV